MDTPGYNPNQSAPAPKSAPRAQEVALDLILNIHADRLDMSEQLERQDVQLARLGLELSRAEREERSLNEANNQLRRYISSADDKETYLGRTIHRMRGEIFRAADALDLDWLTGSAAHAATPAQNAGYTDKASDDSVKCPMCDGTGKVVAWAMDGEGRCPGCYGRKFVAKAHEPFVMRAGASGYWITDGDKGDDAEG